MNRLFFFMLFAMISILSCDQNISEQNSTMQKGDSFTFPEDWLGNWDGNLEIFNKGKKTMDIRMRIIHEQINNSDSIRWAIIYGEDSIKGIRDYLLLPDKNVSNHYLVDERNSIILDGYVHDNSYISAFEIQNNYLLSKYSRENDELIFEIFSHSTKPISITGGQVVNQDTISFVKSFDVGTYQKAVLKRR